MKRLNLALIVIVFVVGGLCLPNDANAGVTGKEYTGIATSFLPGIWIGTWEFRDDSMIVVDGVAVGTYSEIDLFIGGFWSAEIVAPEFPTSESWSGFHFLSTFVSGISTSHQMFGMLNTTPVEETRP